MTVCKILEQICNVASCRSIRADQNLSADARGVSISPPPKKKKKKKKEKKEID